MMLEHWDQLQYLEAHAETLLKLLAIRGREQFDHPLGSLLYTQAKLQMVSRSAGNNLL